MTDETIPTCDGEQCDDDAVGSMPDPRIGTVNLCRACMVERYGPIDPPLETFGDYEHVAEPRDGQSADQAFFRD